MKSPVLTQEYTNLVRRLWSLLLKIMTPSFISRTIQKDFYNLCKGTNALVLQTLYSNDFDSDDSEGGQTVTETMEDVFKANVFICDLNFVMKS